MFKQKYYIVYILLIISFKTYSTTPAYLDSTIKSLKSITNSKEKLNTLYILSYEFGLINPQKGIEYGEQCLELAKKENNLLFQLNGYNGIANAYETLADFEKAKTYHNKSYEIAKKMKEPARMALTLFNVGLCEKQLGNYKSALKLYLRSYNILQKEKSYNPRIHFYLGEIYIRLNDYNQGEFHSRLGVEKCIEFNHDYIIYNLKINLSKCLYHKGQKDSAFVLLESTLRGLKKHTDIISIALCNNAIAELYLQENNYQKALKYYSDELLIQKELKNLSGIYLATLNKAFVLSNLSIANKVEIENYLRENEKLFPLIYKNCDVLFEVYSKTSYIYETINQPILALNQYKKLLVIKDSLLNKEKLQEIIEFQAKYETEKKEQEILTLKQHDLINSMEIAVKTNEVKIRNILIIMSLVCLMLLIILSLFIFQKQKNKAIQEKNKAIQEAEENERLRMAKDIHDDLGSGLSKINFLSEIISQKTNDNSQIIESANSISETTKNLVVNMRDLIWALTPGNMNISGLIARIREYSSDYLEEFSIELKITTTENIPDSNITKESYRTVIMILKESLNNIVKHSKASLVTIDFDLQKESLSILIKDNGIGILNNCKMGNGLKNMQNRCKSIDGFYSIQSDKENGTQIKLQFELSKIIRQ